jgi:hypothetical protein
MEDRKTYKERLKEIIDTRFGGNAKLCAHAFGATRQSIWNAMNESGDLNEAWRTRIDAYELGVMGAGRETLPIESHILKAYELGKND